MPCRPEFILYILRQCVDAPAHVNRFNRDEDIIRTGIFERPEDIGKL